MRVVVVGGGIFGQVLGWRLGLRLAERGGHVTVVEPIGPGNFGSGSGDKSRIVRALYDEPFFAEAGFHGLALWEEWQELLGARLFEKIGVVYLVRKEGVGAAEFHAWVTKGIANVRRLGGVAEEISPSETARRWPAMATDDLAFAVMEPGGGYGRPALACRTFALAAQALGVVVHVAGAVTHVEEKGGRTSGVRVRTLSGDLFLPADVVVIASGFAGVALVEPFCGRLPIQRLAHWTSYWDVPYPEGALLHQSRLPAWADLGAELYGFPDDGENGFKAASHAPRPPETNAANGPSEASLAPSTEGATPEGAPFEGAAPLAKTPPSEPELEALRERVRLRFPAIQNAVCRGTYACAYDSTSDERFQIGPVPNIEGLWFVGGLSGHGFKHAPSLGDSVAAAIVGETPRISLAPYALRVPK